LAELSTRQIAERDEARGLKENEVAAKAGGAISRKAREELEARAGQKVVSAVNSLPPKLMGETAGSLRLPSPPSDLRDDNCPCASVTTTPGRLG